MTAWQVAGSPELFRPSIAGGSNVREAQRPQECPVQERRGHGLGGPAKPGHDHQQPSAMQCFGCPAVWRAVEGNVPARLRPDFPNGLSEAQNALLSYSREEQAGKGKAGKGEEPVPRRPSGLSLTSLCDH